MADRPDPDRLRAPAPPGGGLRSVRMHEPLLGTRVELRLLTVDEASAGRAEQVVIEEVVRLTAVFSVFDPASELSRWRAGDDGAAGPELRRLLGVAADWQDRSAGAFNVASGSLTRLWSDATRTGAPPDAAVLAAEVARIGEPPYALAGDHLVRRADCGAVDLNAIAKGHIVDRAVDRAMAVPGVLGVTVNAGGDLLHRGPGTLVVGIEDPRRPYDNVPPLLRVGISGQALATSGSARRGFRVAGRWYGHVLDPRTGRPVAGIGSASVLALDAATADAVATVTGVLPPGEALAFVDGLEGVGCCLVDREGALWRNGHWRAHELDGHPPARPGPAVTPG